jgi:hypothetical protein
MKNSEYQRLNELKENAEQGKINQFLDTVATPEEIEQVWKILNRDFPGIIKAKDFEWYRVNIKKYSHVKVDNLGYYPLLLERVNSIPSGKIIFYRFFDSYPDPWRGGLEEIAEHILRKIVLGDKVVTLSKKDIEIEGFDEDMVRIFAGHTQYPVRSLRKLIFPELTSSGVGCDYSWHFK